MLFHGMGDTIGDYFTNFCLFLVTCACVLLEKHSEKTADMNSVANLLNTGCKSKLKIGLFLHIRHFALNFCWEISFSLSLSLSSSFVGPKHGLTTRQCCRIPAIWELLPNSFIFHPYKHKTESGNFMHASTMWQTLQLMRRRTEYHPLIFQPWHDSTVGLRWSWKPHFCWREQASPGTRVSSWGWAWRPPGQSPALLKRGLRCG